MQQTILGLFAAGALNSTLVATDEKRRKVNEDNAACKRNDEEQN